MIENKKVEDLKNFPFQNFSEFKEAYSDEVVNLAIDRGASLTFANHSNYTSRWVAIKLIILSLLPYVSGLVYFVYILITKNWWLLLTLPLLVIYFFIFHPSTKRLLGFIATLFSILPFIGLMWGYFNNISWMAAVCITLIIMWYAEREVYKQSINEITKQCLEHEKILSFLWDKKKLNLRFYNGDSYWKDFKKVDGEIITY